MAINEENIISEKFWLNIAAENIYATFEKRATSVTNLRTLITWAFAIFSTGGFSATIFGNIKDFNCTSLVFFGIAFLLLTVGYVLSGEALYPVTQKFHPNDTEEIADAFSNAVKKQSIYFKWASGFTFFAFFFIAFAILFLFLHAKKPAEKIKVSDYPLFVNTTIEKKDTGFSIPVTITTVPNAKTALSISGVNTKDTLVYNEIMKADTSGHLFVSYPATPGFDTFKVKVGVFPKQGKDTLDERFKTIRIIKPKQ